MMWLRSTFEDRAKVIQLDQARRERADEQRTRTILYPAPERVSNVVPLWTADWTPKDAA